MWLIKLGFALVVAYICVIALMYAAQTWMLFPTSLAAKSETDVPTSTVSLEVTTPDGEALKGVHIPAARSEAGEPLLIIGFGGNAWNAASVAMYLHGLYPHADVVAFHYRGYEPSSGSPSASMLLSDALVVHDRVEEIGDTEHVVAVGFSIGAGVAAYLASHRPLSGLILVSPFDSLEALARDHYPWAPIGWLLRHHMPVVEFVRGLTIPIALLTAGRDTVVPPRRTIAVRKAISSLVLDRTIADVGHNGLYRDPDFRTAMVEALARIEKAQSKKRITVP